MLSRTEVVMKTEWRLSAKTFRWICRESVRGPPEVDLFANRLNHLLPRYMSPCEDLGAEAVDALLSPWPRAICYAFPPTTILGRVAVKLLSERPNRLLLVAPWWPTKAWFPTLQLNAFRVTMIPGEQLTLEQPHFRHEMPMATSLCLALWHISFRD
jgi:hypothetical protein